MRISKLYAHSSKSEGAKNLARGLGIKMLKHQGSVFKGGPGKTVLNWGSSRIPQEFLQGSEIINHPDRVGIASDKLQTFRTLLNHGVQTPPITSNLRDAQRWLGEGSIVFARTMLRASSGRGIVVMDPAHPDTHETRAELYVKYIPKQSEYRIHVMRGEVIDRQRKGLSAEWQGRDDINWHIRNLENGFIYVRNDGQPIPNGVEEQALAAVRALQLSFGAVDVIYNRNRGLAYVLEVNTAPGLTGTTVDNYVEAFNKFFA